MHSMNHTIIPFSFASFYLKTKKQREIKSKIIRLDEKWGICTVCNRACKPRLG